MYKDVLRSIDDISLFPVIAILIFFVFFAIILVRVIRMDRKKVDILSSIPLETYPTRDSSHTQAEVK